MSWKLLWLLSSSWLTLGSLGRGLNHVFLNDCWDGLDWNVVRHENGINLWLSISIGTLVLSLVSSISIGSSILTVRGVILIILENKVFFNRSVAAT